MAKQRNAVESCWEGFEAFKAFKAFKGCWKRARWQFQSKALPGYLFFLPRLFVLSRVLFSKGYSDLFSHSWMLSTVSMTITCSAYRSSMPTLVENTFVLNAWCLVNVLMYLVMNGSKNVIDKKRTVDGSNLIRAPWTSAGSGSEPF